MADIGDKLRSAREAKGLSIEDIEKATKIYSIVTKNNKNKMTRFYKDLSCNFKLLEEKSLEYKN